MRSSPVDASSLETFLELSVHLHGHDPAWIPPIEAPLARDLVGQGTFGAYGELQMILCEEGGRVVGRVAAIHNPRLPGIGQLGHFESIDDLRVLPSLLEVAMPWFASRGLTEVWGPMDGAAHKTHRFMTRGFETQPFLFEPRNPAYYPALFESQGFKAMHRWHSYELSIDQIQEVRQRLGRAAQRTLRAQSKSFFDDLSDPRVLPRLHGLLDRVWAGHLGYAPMELEEFAENYAGILAITRPLYLGFVQDGDGDDVALGLCYPDWSDQVRELRGDAAGWAGWDPTTLPRRLVMHTVAVVPEVRGAGPALVVVNHACEQLLDDGFEEVVVALVVEEFPLFRRFTEPSREYALYRRPL